MEGNSLSSLRNRLKSWICRRRLILSKGKFLPECAACGEGIDTAPDMHEVFLTKGDVMKSDPYVKEKHITANNCVMVHPGGNTSPCHAFAATKEGQRVCILHIVKWEGYEKVHRWLTEMNVLMRGSQAIKARRLLEEVAMEKCSVCKKDLKGHDKDQFMKCLDKAGLLLDESEELDLFSLDGAIAFGRSLRILASVSQRSSDKNEFTLGWRGDPVELVTKDVPNAILKRVLLEAKAEPVEVVTEDEQPELEEVPEEEEED